MRLTIKDLMIPNAHRWYHIFVSTVFSNQMAVKIMQILILEDTNKDVRIWSLSKDGFYSVKSAYTLAMDCFGNQKQYHVERNWMVIWRMNAPKKIKVFFVKSMPLYMLFFVNRL